MSYIITVGLGRLSLNALLLIIIPISHVKITDV